MVIVNDQKFVQNKNQLIDTLFSGGGTASGFYSIKPDCIQFYNLQKIETFKIFDKLTIGKNQKIQKQYFGTKNLLSN